MSELETKIRKARTIKSLRHITDKLCESLHGNWIAYVGYNRQEHEKEMRRLIKLANERIEEIKDKA